jgi:hypothetical protein
MVRGWMPLFLYAFLATATDYNRSTHKSNQSPY